MSLNVDWSFIGDENLDRPTACKGNDSDDDDGRLTVFGHAEIKADADTFVVQVETRARSKDVARTREAVLQVIRTALDRARSTEAAVVSSNVGSTPIYTRPKEGEASQLSGYEISSTLTLQWTSTEDMRRDISVISEGLPLSIRSLRYEIRNRAELERRVARLAAERAREQARNLAQATGVSLDRLVSISTQISDPGPQMTRSRAMAESESADSQTDTSGVFPVVFAKLPISARVYLVYEIVPEKKNELKAAMQRFN